MAGTDTQRAYCQNCCLISRDKYFAIFAAVARADKVLGSSNFGNMPPRCTQAGDSAVETSEKPER